MKQLPNIITLFRITGSLGLLFCDVTGVMFWIISTFAAIQEGHQP
jgi:CDP-diacylglycerol--glycerol-3-phosphate 3-phosphatidyltransferase